MKRVCRGPGECGPWTFADALKPLVEKIEIVPLTDPVFWGKKIVDERYLLVADV